MKDVFGEGLRDGHAEGRSRHLQADFDAGHGAVVIGALNVNGPVKAAFEFG